VTILFEWNGANKAGHLSPSLESEQKLVDQTHRNGTTKKEYDEEEDTLKATTSRLPKSTSVQAGA